ncbi:oxidoreductase [Thalassiella azotivora]
MSGSRVPLPVVLPDLSGRTALVTGASSGIGLEVCRALAAAGAHVLMASRDPARADEALGAVRVGVPGALVDHVPLDLTDLASVRTAAGDVRRRVGRLDLLVADAGVMAVPRSVTVDGFERQLATNHLGHFALGGLLLDLLQAAADDGGDARVVSVTSIAHRRGRLDREDLMGERRYRPWDAYAQSKLANVLFALELHRRLVAAGSAVRSVAAHPGVAATNLVAAGPMARSTVAARVLGPLVGAVTATFLNDARLGAAPVLVAATGGDVAGGDLWGPTGFGEARGAPGRVRPASAALDPDDAAWLWERSQELTGVRWTLPSSS